MPAPEIDAAATAFTAAGARLVLIAADTGNTDVGGRSRIGPGIDAVARRGDLVASTATTAYRVIHGENDAMPGCVIDRYGSTLVLKLYSASWLGLLPTLVPLIDELLRPDALILRLSRHVGRGDTGGLVDGQALIGNAPDAPIEFAENGLVFEADVVRGQKTGFFLDQRDNRFRVRSLASGARVLDVFSCSGGFSVNAAAGGATLVHSVDISAHAIDAAKANMERNDKRPAVRACRHEVTTGDAFEVMEHMMSRGRQFDLVLVDPPSFASSQRQIDGALRSYARLAELAVSLVSRGGTLVACSCSSRVTGPEFAGAVREGADRAGARLSDISHSTHPVDHPVGFAHGAYLKALTARVDARR